MRFNLGRLCGQRALVFFFMALGQFFVTQVLMPQMMSQAVAQEISVSAELSASQITRDESVTLTVTAVGLDAELDASSLNADFDVVGRSSSRQISTTIGINNQRSNVSVVTWALELLPKGQGVFTVPAVKVGDYETQLLTLTVNELAQGAKRDIFLEVSVDTTEPWVQSQVLMTLQVFQAIDIIDGGLDSPTGADLTVQRIGDDTQRVEERDGREYRVTERRFSVFPQKSGLVTIEPVTLSVTVPADPTRVRGFFSPTRKLTRRSDAIVLDVQARPSSFSSWWLPAKALSLQSEWQADLDTAQVDQPLTRTIVMRAEGVLDSQLPEIAIPAIDGVSLYAEEPQQGMGGDERGLVSEQRINWALIPQRTGPLTLPAITVEWFNTITGQIQSTVLPEETIMVRAATGSSGQTTDFAGPGSEAESLTSSQSDSSADSLAGLPGSDTSAASQASDNATQQSLSAIDSNEGLDSISAAGLQGPRIIALESSVQRWRALALAVIFAWLLAGLYWLFRRVSRGGVQSSRTAASNTFAAVQKRIAPLSEVQQACKQGDLLQIKRSLLEWSKEQWTQSPPATLDSLQERLPDGAARNKLSVLQSALYSRDGYTESMPALANQLQKLPEELTLAIKQVHNSCVNDNPESGKLRQSQLPPL